MRKLFLSPSSIGIFKECPRCFWLAKNRKIDRPDTIFPSLPGGIDRVVKEHYDRFRKAGAVPDIFLDHPIKLFQDQLKLNAWRNWRSGLKVIGQGWDLGGAVDDLCATDFGTFVVADYKTKGSEPKGEDDESHRKYYGGQFNSYGLMLRENGYKPEPYGFLIYFWPIIVEGAETSGVVSVKFGTKLVKIPVDPDAALKDCEDAYDCACSGTIPEPGEGCEFCNWKKRLEGEGL